MMEYSDTVPVQYAEGSARFMGMDILLEPGVFIPRPETELLIRTIADLCRKKGRKDPLILDIGTGSGIIPLGLARLLKNCRVIGVDVSRDALRIAGQNVERFKHEDRITLMRSDMFEAFGPEHEGIFTAVVSNPPYVSGSSYEKLDAWVKAEPRVALYAGEEGMDYLRVLAEESGKFLKGGGFIAVEVGYDQAGKVKKLFKWAGFTGIRGYFDFNGYERVIVGWKHG